MIASTDLAFGSITSMTVSKCFAISNCVTCRPSAAGAPVAGDRGFQLLDGTSKRADDERDPSGVRFWDYAATDRLGRNVRTFKEAEGHRFICWADLARAVAAA